jgi:hypothetical protein
VSSLLIYPEGGVELSKGSCHLDFIDATLKKAGIKTSIPYVMHDMYVTKAYKDTSYYPNNLAEKLVDKKQLQDVMTQNGFNALKAELVTDVDVITLNDFIVKFRYSSGKLGVSKNKAYIYNPFEGVPFKNKEELKTHPLFDIALFSTGNFIVQEDAGIRKHTLATVAAVANSNSDLLFLRNTTDEWQYLTRKSTTLSFNIYPELNSKIQDFFKINKIKNAAVTVQFVIKDKKYYPVDWNFRFGINMGKEMRARNPIEFETAILHMVGDTATPQFTSTDVWLTEFK